MVRLAGFEPATYGLEVRCSIQLSYRRKQRGLLSKILLVVHKKMKCLELFEKYFTFIEIMIMVY